MKLHFKKGDAADHELDAVRVTIGREAENAITLESDDISGFHAEIQRDGDKLFLIDLGSSNGTSHNGQPVRGRVELRPWDRIAFASIEAEIVDPNSRRPTRAMPAVNPDAAPPQAPAAGATRPIDPHATTVRPAATGWSLSGISEDVAGQRVPLAATMTVGRDQSCDLTLPNELASREHARMSLKDDRLTVEDLGSTNGTWVNGKRIESPTVVSSGDELRFDTTVYRVEGVDSGKTAVRKAVDDSAPAPKPVPGAVLRPDGGKPIRLTRSHSIGRLPDNDIVLDDDTVSGHHARIEPAGGQWKLEDLGSSNGTTVNGRTVKQATLSGGERIGFGEVELTLETARSGSTRHVKAVGGGTGTRIQKAVGDSSASSSRAETRTSTHAASSRSSMPPWIWGLVGFVAVIIGAGIWMLMDRGGIPSQQIQAPLQAGVTWTQQLGDGGETRSVVATPVIADVNGDGFLDLVVADSGGFVTALDGQEGKRIFEAAVPGRVVASLAVADLDADGVDDVVVGTTRGRVIALNGEGQTLWSSGDDLGFGQITNRPAFVDVNGDGVEDAIVPTMSRGLVALDGSRGWEIWSSEEMSSGAVVSTPAIGDFNADGAIDFGYLTQNGEAVAVSSADSRVWRLWLSEEVGTPDYASPALMRVGDRNLLVFATADGVTALNAGDGRPAWMNRSGDSFVASPVVVRGLQGGGSGVAVIGREGHVRVLVGETGEVLWETELEGRVIASPALFDVTNDRLDDLLIQRADGVLLAMDADRGRVALSLEAGSGSSVSASPLVADLTNDGLVEVTVVDEGGRITAYTMNRRVREGAGVWPMMLADRAGGRN